MENLVEQMHAIAIAVDQLGQRVAAQENRPPVPAPQAVGGQPEPKIPLPDKFFGDRAAFSNFKNSCLLYFQLRPQSSGTEAQQVGFIMSLLRGDPQTWAFGLPATDPARRSVTGFFSSMGILYADPDVASTAEAKLRALRQGRRPAEDYCSEFRRWAVDCEWNDAALRSQFRIGLADTIKDVLVNHPTPQTLDQAMNLAIRIDRRLRERRSEKPGYVAPSPDFSAFSEAPSTPSDEPK